MLWTDEDFDWKFFIDYLLPKFRKMEKFYYSDKTVAVGAKKIGADIKECRILLERIQADEYFNNVYKNFDEKWGAWGSGPTEPGKKVTFRSLFKRKNVITNSFSKKRI